jgi:glycosyltransferase involved in cell wall biosynthesis
MQVTVGLPAADGLASVYRDLAHESIDLAGLEAWPLFAFSEHRFLEAREDAIRLLQREQFDAVVIVLPAVQFGGALIDAAASLDVPAAVVYQLVPYAPRFIPIERHVYTAARRGRQAWVTVSRQNRGLLCDALGWTEDAIQVVHNSLHRDVQAARPAERGAAAASLRSELGLPDGTSIILTVGRLHHQKGYDVLVRAVQRLHHRRKDFHCVWAGGGELHDDLAAEIRRRGLDARITMLGARSDIVRLLHAADLFVLPSRFEGFPFAPLEAMAAGTPVVLSDIGPHRELASPAEAVFVAVENADALTDALHDGLVDRAAADRRAAAALARAEGFRPAQSFERIMALLDEARIAPEPPGRWPLTTRPGRLAVFGAGSAGRMTRQRLDGGDQVVAFLDSAATASTPPVDGLPVHPPSAVHALDLDAVIVASVHADSMCATLAGLGYPSERVVRYPVARLLPVG